MSTFIPVSPNPPLLGSFLFLFMVPVPCHSHDLCIIFSFLPNPPPTYLQLSPSWLLHEAFTIDPAGRPQTTRNPGGRPQGAGPGQSPSLPRHVHSRPPLRLKSCEGAPSDSRPVPPRYHLLISLSAAHSLWNAPHRLKQGSPKFSAHPHPAEAWGKLRGRGHSPTDSVSQGV